MSMKQNTPSRRRRILLKKLRRRFGEGQGHIPLLKRIILLANGDLDLIEEYEKMLDWCTSKHKNPSVRRFLNWIKNTIKWKEEKKGNEDFDLDTYERQKLQQQLAEHRASRSSNSKQGS